MTRAVLLALTLACAQAPLHAQTISGRVLDGSSGEPRPVAFALIRLSDVRRGPVATAATDAEGRFSIPTPEDGGVFRLYIETLFHRPTTTDSLRIAAGESVTVPDILLEPVPFELDSLNVEVERPKLLQGREWVRQNQLLGTGKFLSGALVDMNAGRSLAGYISDHTKLWVRYDIRGHGMLLNPSGALSRCVQVLVNRWRIERTNYTSIDQIPRRDIAAIEIYENDRDIPQGYAFDGRPGCGIVNVWTWRSW